MSDNFSNKEQITYALGVAATATRLYGRYLGDLNKARSLDKVKFDHTGWNPLSPAEFADRFGISGLGLKKDWIPTVLKKLEYDISCTLKPNSGIQTYDLVLDPEHADTLFQNKLSSVAAEMMVLLQASKDPCLLTNFAGSKLIFPEPEILQLTYPEQSFVDFDNSGVYVTNELHFKPGTPNRANMFAGAISNLICHACPMALSGACLHWADHNAMKNAGDKEAPKLPYIIRGKIRP